MAFGRPSQSNSSSESDSSSESNHSSGSDSPTQLNPAPQSRRPAKSEWSRQREAIGDQCYNHPAAHSILFTGVEGDQMKLVEKDALEWDAKSPSLLSLLAWQLSALIALKDKTRLPLRRDWILSNTLNHQNLDEYLKYQQSVSDLGSGIFRKLEDHPWKDTTDKVKRELYLDARNAVRHPLADFWEMDTMDESQRKVRREDMRQTLLSMKGSWDDSYPDKVNQYVDRLIDRPEGDEQRATNLAHVRWFEQISEKLSEHEQVCDEMGRWSLASPTTDQAGVCEDEFDVRQIPESVGVESTYARLVDAIQQVEIPEAERFDSLNGVNPDKWLKIEGEGSCDEAGTDWPSSEVASRYRERREKLQRIATMLSNSLNRYNHNSRLEHFKTLDMRPNRAKRSYREAVRSEKWRQTLPLQVAAHRTANSLLKDVGSLYDRVQVSKDSKVAVDMLKRSLQLALLDEDGKMKKDAQHSSFSHLLISALNTDPFHHLGCKMPEKESDRSLMMKKLTDRAKSLRNDESWTRDEPPLYPLFAGRVSATPSSSHGDTPLDPLASIPEGPIRDLLEEEPELIERMAWIPERRYTRVLLKDVMDPNIADADRPGPDEMSLLGAACVVRGLCDTKWESKIAPKAMSFEPNQTTSFFHNQEYEDVCFAAVESGHQLQHTLTECKSEQTDGGAIWEVAQEIVNDPRAILRGLQALSPSDRAAQMSQYRSDLSKPFSHWTGGKKVAAETRIQYYLDDLDTRPVQNGRDSFDLSNYDAFASPRDALLACEEKVAGKGYWTLVDAPPNYRRDRGLGLMSSVEDLRDKGYQVPIPPRNRGKDGTFDPPLTDAEILYMNMTDWRQRERIAWSPVGSHDHYKLRHLDLHSPPSEALPLLTTQLEVSESLKRRPDAYIAPPSSRLRPSQTAEYESVQPYEDQRIWIEQEANKVDEQLRNHSWTNYEQGTEERTLLDKCSKAVQDPMKLFGRLQKLRGGKRKKKLDRFKDELSRLSTAEDSDLGTGLVEALTRRPDDNTFALASEYYELLKRYREAEEACPPTKGQWVQTPSVDLKSYNFLLESSDTYDPDAGQEPRFGPSERSAIDYSDDSEEDE